LRATLRAPRRRSAFAFATRRRQPRPPSGTSMADIGWRACFRRTSMQTMRARTLQSSSSPLRSPCALRAHASRCAIRASVELVPLCGRSPPAWCAQLLLTLAGFRLSRATCPLSLVRRSPCSCSMHAGACRRSAVGRGCTRCMPTFLI
jgi:hypothetical protein